MSGNTKGYIDRHDPPYWLRPFIWRQVQVERNGQTHGYWRVCHPEHNVSKTFPDLRHGGIWQALDAAFDYAIEQLYERDIYPLKVAKAARADRAVWYLAPTQRQNGATRHPSPTSKRTNGHAERHAIA